MLQSIPDDYFSPAAENLVTIDVWNNLQTAVCQVQKTVIPRKNLQKWAQADTNALEWNGLHLVFRCLIVSTNEYNDFPVAIARDDLFSMAEAFKISDTLVHMIFAPYTSFVALDGQACWYYGLPGLRALSSVSETCSRAIITIGSSEQDEFEDDLRKFARFARHPLMPALAIRSNILRGSEKTMLTDVRSLWEAENVTGYHASYGEDADDGLPVQPPKAAEIDLGKLTRLVGSGAANLGNFKIILAQLGSLRELLYVGDRLRWRDRFTQQAAQNYEKLSEEMAEIDAVHDAMRKGLLTSIPEYQNRARTLQSVIFNLIAKEDANASIDLARESRAIAIATRNDGTSMKTIAVMTMIFLPATFYAALFAVPTLQWQQSPVIQTKFWVYWAFTLPSTIVVLFTWYVIVSRQVAQEKRTGELTNRTSRQRNTWKLCIGSTTGFNKELPFFKHDRSSSEKARAANAASTSGGCGSVRQRSVGKEHDPV